MKKSIKIGGLITIITTASVLGIIYIPILIDTWGPIPQFASHDWIELDKIGNITKFHSTIGHGYPGDDNPTSDKHYFYQYDCYNDTTTKISTFAPAYVRVVKIVWEEHVLKNGEIQGKQIHLQSIEHPSITFVIFHQNIEKTGLEVGQILHSGDQVGYCDLREAVNIDIAVFRGFGTISWFQVISLDLLAKYEKRGVILEKIIKTDDQIAQSEKDGYDFSHSDPSDIVDLTNTNPCS